MTQNTKVQRMKLGIALETAEGYLDGRTPTFHDLQEMAQTAEQIGLDSLWLADHLLHRFREQEEYGIWEALTFLSALAAVTTRIVLGPLVACTSFRSPALLAKMADALDEISGGRFILGLGAGWHQPECLCCVRGTSISRDSTTRYATVCYDREAHRHPARPF